MNELIAKFDEFNQHVDDSIEWLNEETRAP
jgi:hypothetical protein